MMMREDWIYRRGDIYMANLDPYVGSEQGGWRPVLVLQNNVGNIYCPTLIVAPLTKRVYKKSYLPTHYVLEGVRKLEERTMVLLEQIKTIDKRRVDHYITKVSKDQMREIDEAILVSLGFEIPAEVEAP